jgi:hypothetical protein
MIFQKQHQASIGNSSKLDSGMEGAWKEFVSDDGQLGLTATKQQNVTECSKTFITYQV